MVGRIVEDIKQKGSASIYLFYGDEFLVKEKVHALVAQVLDPASRETNLVIMDGSTLNAADLSTEVLTPSFFGGPKVVIVDQTTLFMGRKDHKKATSKALDAWKAGDRTSAMKGFAQLVALLGLETGVQADPAEMLRELLGDAPDSDDAEALVRLAEAFRAEGISVKGGQDEQAVEEIILSDFPDETILVFTAPGADERKKLFKTVKARGTVLECAAKEEKYGTALDREFFDGYVLETLAREGKTIRPPALDEMYHRSGKELRRIRVELEKLVAFVGARAQVTAEDVKEVFADFHHGAVFELSNKIRSRNLPACLTALHEQGKAGMQPLQTLGMIANEFRRLIVARELLFTVFRGLWKPGMTYNQFVPVAKQARAAHPELGRKEKLNLLSMNDYPLYLCLKDAQRFPMEQLAAGMGAIAETDLLLKSSRLAAASPETILERLLCKICA
ncbi:MAG: DNA polymerase III subunit delta [Thermodesulfobacteriota bacterium]